MEDQNGDRNMYSENQAHGVSEENKDSMGNCARGHLIWYYNNRKGTLPLKHNPLKDPGCKFLLKKHLRGPSFENGITWKNVFSGSAM